MYKLWELSWADAKKSCKGKHCDPVIWEGKVWAKSADEAIKYFVDTIRNEWGYKGLEKERIVGDYAEWSAEPSTILDNDEMAIVEADYYQD